MGLESATFIDGLVATNPTASDNANQGDNHIRLIKSAVKATFPNVTGAVTVTHSQLNSVAGKLDLAGGTMTGALTVLTPSATGHAATKGYVDTGLATKANSSHTHIIADVTGLQTALDARVRVDTATQGLSEAQKANARTNLGITTAGTAMSTDDIPEGSTNVYFTTTRARGAFTAGTGISISGGVISSTLSVPVTSVAGKTGAVTLATADISGLDTALAGKASTSSLSSYLALTGGTLSGGLTISTGNLALSSGNLSVTGTITASGDITAFSDARIKTNVETINEAVYKVTQLRGVQYVSRLDMREHIGVIAQEVERVVPEVVLTHENGSKSVAYGNLVGLLIEAIKDLNKRVVELENR